MDDKEVIEAFANGGARRAFGPEVHIEGDALFLNGWWQTAFRISPDVFIVRNEQAPDGSQIVKVVGDALAARGLKEVGVDLPAMLPITYVELTLGDTSWTLWSSDRGAGERALATRATTESFFGDQNRDTGVMADLGAEVGGARRLAGLPAALILAVGLAADSVRQLEASLAECRIVSRTFDTIDSDSCSALMPTAILVDASESAGKNFVTGLRTGESCRYLPVAAIVGFSGSVPGADICLDRNEPPSSWADSLRRILT